MASPYLLYTSFHAIPHPYQTIASERTTCLHDSLVWHGSCFQVLFQKAGFRQARRKQCSWEFYSPPGKRLRPPLSSESWLWCWAHAGRRGKAPVPVGSGSRQPDWALEWFSSSHVPCTMTHCTDLGSVYSPQAFAFSVITTDVIQYSGVSFVPRINILFLIHF